MADAAVIDLAPLRAAIDGVTDTRGMLIPLLQETQRLYGYVPEEAAGLLADRLGIYRSHVYGVLTFYAQFHLTPRGRHTIRVCAGTACHVRGGDRVIDRLEKLLGVGHGGTTADGAFSYEKVACLGACGLAPVVMTDDDAHGGVDPAKAERIVRDLRRAMAPSAAAKASADKPVKA
jgi:NADH-quinone oxidoreductase subunit E